MTNKLEQFFRCTGVQKFIEMNKRELAKVKRVQELSYRSVVIGDNAPCGAMVTDLVCNRMFSASTYEEDHGAIIALNDAREAGICGTITLMMSVPNNADRNPLKDEVLKLLSEFESATIMLVGDDSMVFGELTSQRFN